MTLFTRIVDRCFAAASAIVFLQAPQFIRDYTQVLHGHLAEVSWQVNQIQKLASKSHSSINDLIQKYLSHSDPDISFQGNFVEMLIQREQEYNHAFQALSHANPLQKPFVFLKSFQWDLFKETLNLFTPGLPLSLEGLIWAFLGLIAGYLLFRTLCFLARAAIPRKKPA